MTNTVNRHTLSALAALALVSAFATNGVAGNTRMRVQHFQDEFTNTPKGNASKSSPHLSTGTNGTKKQGQTVPKGRGLGLDHTMTNKQR